jgi:hypothetical protein
MKKMKTRKMMKMKMKMKSLPAEEFQWTSIFPRTLDWCLLIPLDALMFLNMIQRR